MQFRRLRSEQTILLNYLYEFRNTPMTPPDPRISYAGVCESLGIKVKDLFSHLDALKKRGFIMPFRIGKQEFYKITLAGIRDVERSTITTLEGELSTSKIGIKSKRKEAIG